MDQIILFLSLSPSLIFLGKQKRKTREISLVSTVYKKSQREVEAGTFERASKKRGMQRAIRHILASRLTLQLCRTRGSRMGGSGPPPCSLRLASQARACRQAALGLPSPVRNPAVLHWRAQGRTFSTQGPAPGADSGERSHSLLREQWRPSSLLLEVLPV